jgi:hypothetical protein
MRSMYDDDEEVEEVVEVYEVPAEEDYYEEEEDFEDDTPDPGVARGFADRAFVDEQAKEQEAKKKAKRDKLASLKQSLLADKSLLTKKEHEVHLLEQEIKKDTYLETRERVVRAREEIGMDEGEKEEQSRTEEFAEIEQHSQRRERADQHERLSKELGEIKAAINEKVRAIAMIEQELLRS